MRQEAGGIKGGAGYAVCLGATAYPRLPGCLDRTHLCAGGAAAPYDTIPAGGRP